MKNFLFIIAFGLITSTANAQYPAYRNGLNGPGSYYSRGSSNYQSGVFVNGSRYNRTYVPGFSYPVYVPSFNQYNQNRMYQQRYQHSYTNRKGIGR